MKKKFRDGDLPQYRHGDLLLEKVLPEDLPKDLKEREGGVILEGEETGHAHRIDSCATVLDSAALEKAYVIVNEAKARLTHEDHHLIEVPKGPYVVVRQREYSAYDEAIHQVQD